MAPVSAAEKAALDAFFKGKRGERVLIEQVADALILYFANKGTTLAELATIRPSDPTRLGDFQDEWLDAAKAAGITDTLDAKNVVRWISEESTVAARDGSRLGRAAAVADALTQKGIAIDRAASLAIATALAAADAGDTASQCRDFVVIWLIYTGQSPGDEERRLFQEKRMACTVEDKDPIVDIRMFKSYVKQLSTTAVPTLERALREPTGRMWADYYAKVLRLLDENGYVHASKRWMAVTNYAKKVSSGDFNRERRYLQLYFFEEHLGRGMPEDRCTLAALQIASLDPAQPVPQLAPTVPSDVRTLEDQMALLGQCSQPAAPTMYSRLPPWQMQQMLGATQAWQQGYNAPVAYPVIPGMVQQMLPPPPGAAPPGYGAPTNEPGSGIEEMPPAPAEQIPCLFCGGKHVQSKCTLYIQARNAQAKATAEKVAAKKAAAEAKAAEKAAAAAAAGSSTPPVGTPT